NKLFKLPDDTTLYPGHDYRGWMASSIGEEKRCNPRLAGKSEAEYVAIMKGLNLPNPKLMDIAVPANLACGQS
ncbi:MAG: MBL fold metallo-hydrolase, partial [Panacagrimonas sp.]